jgi:hypothetical protein
VILIVLGVLFLLSNFGWIPGDVPIVVERGRMSAPIW